MKYAIGIDLGGSHMSAALVDEFGTIKYPETRETVVSRGIGGICQDLAALTHHVISQLPPDITLCGIGLGIPGSVHPHTHHVINANNLGWEDTPLLPMLSTVFPELPIHLINDASAATLAEHRIGALRHYNSCLLLTMGTGLGGGMLHQGKLYEGSTGYGFEPGHITIRTDGRPCTCGRKGCLESYVSTKGLRLNWEYARKKFRQASLFPRGGFDAKILFQASAEGNPAARYAEDHFIKDLCFGLSSLIVILQPEAIALGGGLSQRGQEFYQKINQGIREQLTLQRNLPVPPVFAAQTSNNAGMIGAAFFAILASES